VESLISERYISTAMPHNTAIQAFNGINSASSGALLTQLYGALVTLELLAKDHLVATTGSWPKGHDVCVMLVTIDGTLTAPCTQLKSNLERLICTNLTGSEATVRASQYPDVRYLRHIADFPAWPLSSDDPALQNAIDDARLCLQQLKTLGIKP
jgi:hypothetical protein